MKIIILISFIFLVVSCRKERLFHVSAKNPISGLPYSGLNFTISNERVGIFENKTKIVFQGKLNENGEAFVKVKVNGNRVYRVDCEAPPNNCYFNKISFNYTKEDGDKTDFNFEYAACAYNNYSFNNLNCQNSSDKLRVYTSNELKSFNGDKYTDFFGCILQPNISYFSKVPIGKYFYKFEVTKLGITNTFYDTIVLTENEYETTYFNY
jgi:hypothetical protein